MPRFRTPLGLDLWYFPVAGLGPLSFLRLKEELRPKCCLEMANLESDQLSLVGRRLERRNLERPRHLSLAELLVPLPRLVYSVIYFRN